MLGDNEFMAAQSNVIFVPDEARFVQVTMQAFSQNQPLSNETDSGGQPGISPTERVLVLSILSKVRIQMSYPTQPISFTEAEAGLAQRMYFHYLETHGKPQGDQDFAYYIRLKDTSVQLVVNVLRKFGAKLPNYVSDTYPPMFNPYQRL